MCAIGSVALFFPAPLPRGVASPLNTLAEGFPLGRFLPAPITNGIDATHAGDHFRGVDAFIHCARWRFEWLSL